MDNNSLNRIYQFCHLLNNKCLANEIKEYLKGYTIIPTENKEKTHEINLENNQGHHINIRFGYNYFIMMKTIENSVEKTTIYPHPLTTEVSQNINNKELVYSNILMTRRMVEKREKGLLVKDNEKYYARSKKYNNEIVLTDLTESRYIFTKETADKSFTNLKFNNTTPLTYLLKINQLEIFFYSLYTSCDYSSNFESHMNYYDNNDARNIKDNIYPHRTYLQGEDITRLYDLVDGPDKIYRIYDLYRGTINRRNEQDIHSINLGLLSESSFDLLTLKGITEKENNLIGEPTNNNKEYYNYLKNFFNVKYGYQEEFTLDRDSILKIINPQISIDAQIKIIVETKLGIPYSEYQKLNWQEQYKLIEEKTGQKVLPNYLLLIDGISMDKEHMVTNKKVTEKKIATLKENEKITKYNPKKLIRKIFQKK